MTDDVYPIYPLRFVTGDTLRKKLTFSDPDPDSLDPENPTMIPRDLTGYTAAAQIRKNAKSETVLSTFEISSLGNDGVIIITLTAEESQNLRVTNKAAWDLELTDPSGEVTTVIGGPVELVLDVTRE